MKTFIYQIKLLISWVGEIIYPSSCFGCGKKDEIFCEGCIPKTSRNNKVLENKIYTVFDYQDPLIKKIIWNLKYYHHPNLGQKLGKILYEELVEEISEIKSYLISQPIIVIPVPLSKDKIKNRGYNQAKKIAYGFCEQGGFENFILKTNIIFKKKETPPQARINHRDKRLKNIRDAFGVKNIEKIKGKTIFVIDDVTTTGGTLLEIIKILKESGAKEVIGFAFAH